MAQIIHNEPYSSMSDDELIQKSEQLKDFLTPNMQGWNELMELLEVEREITLREK